MATKLLSDRKIASLKAVPAGESKEREYLAPDGGGLYIRVRPNGTPKGSQSWIFVYTCAGGRRGKLVLGAVGDHSQKAARDWASEQRALLDRGIDPRTARQQEAYENAQKQRRTLGALLDAYIAHLRKQGKPSASDAEGIFRLHVPARLKDQPAADVRHEDLVKAMRKLTELRRGRTAAKLRSYLHAAFARGLDASDDPDAASDLIGFGLTANPVSRIKTLSGYSKPGERALSRAELAELVARIDAMPNGDTKDALRLALLLGGQRLTQLARGELSHDSDGNETVVLRDIKGKRQLPRRHELPLIGKAKELVTARGSRLFADNEKVTAKTHLQNVSKAVLKIAREMEADGTATALFRFGDVRRTAETHLAKLRVSKDLRAQLQSHGLSGVQDRHYDRHDYLVEKANVLAAWEAYLANAPD